MPRLSFFNESAIRQRADGESFRRGQDYLARGAVTGVVRRGDQISAEVEGSRYEPYRVDVTLDATGLIRAATCTCPYEYGGDCKHIVAVLLTSLQTPEAVEERPPLAELLDTLDRERLRALVLDLAAQHPDLMPLIERRIEAATLSASSARPAATSRRRTALDPNTFRRQVSAAVHSLSRMRPSEAYWQVGSVAREVVSVAEQARPFIENGDGRSALAILEAVTDEYVNTWTELDDSDGEASAAFTELGALLTEAVLTADLTLDERQEWAKRLQRWDREAADYGVDDAFIAAEAAAIQGWDDPRLRHLLAGGTAATAPPGRTAEMAGNASDDDLDDEFEDYDGYGDEDDDEEGERAADREWYAHALTDARLRILERQGRSAEYLNLARGAGRWVAYVTMLVREGRAEEAVTEGIERLTSPGEALALARALQEQGRGADAFRVAEHGLTLPEPSFGTYYSAGWSGSDEVWSAITPPSVQRQELARWLREGAQAAGDVALALKAARVAVEASADLGDYVAVQSLAGAGWPAERDAILAHLRRGAPASRVRTVDIVLHEGLIDEAIAIADAASYHYGLVEQVARAAVESRPEWVMRSTRAQAESIIEAGRANHYDTAVRWLSLMRDAAVAAGRDEEWLGYLDGLLDRHRRKYKLVPMLKTLL